jgi:signal transduction histidine kinase
MFLGIAAWVARGLGGETLRRLALPIAAASAAPLILLSIPSVLPAPLVFAAAALPPGAQLVLADGLVERVARGTWRRAAAFVAVAASIGYLAVQWAFFGPSSAVRVGPPDVAAILAVMLIASIALVPAAILVVSGNRARVLSGVPHVGRGDWLPIALAALTPTVISIGYVALGLGVDLPLMWLLIVVIVLQANARVETLRTQRDTVVAATEAERARLAADLHDDALQEMTVLVRRLDQTGDVRAAAVARSIADSLREVCGELRLPILDELGAGPALEWLVERVGHASGHPVTLERADAGRPPSDVELAVFRVAQEALANAVTHGAPPVVVRYEATPDRALLSIIDHGRGIAADAATLAGRSGHYGLLNMRQRADQIGARFDVRRPPNGGTVIGLTWARA